VPLRLKVYVVDFDAPRAWTALPLRARRRLVAGGLAALCVVPSAVVLADLPHRFMDGEILTADALNAGFGDLDQRLSQLEGALMAHDAGAVGDADAGQGQFHLVIERNDASYSFGATYCGPTVKLPGKIVMRDATGYAAGKQQCELTCNSKSAHMCSGSEVQASAQMALVMVSGWVSDGHADIYSNLPHNDCLGWQSDSANIVGSIWWGPDADPMFQPNTPGAAACNRPFPVLCCD
jgi:hypothetical protein